MGLFAVSGIAGRNLNLPILNNILIEVEEKSIKLLSTNLEIGIECFVRGKADTGGRVVLPAKIIYDYVSLLPNEAVNLELVENELDVRCSKYKTKIKTAQAEEFPLIPKIKEENKLLINKEEFKKTLSQALFAASLDEMRAELGGVLLKYTKNNKTLEVAATDSYRLAEKKIKIQSDANDFKVIVPAKSLQELVRIIAGYKEEIEDKGDIEIYISENQAVFAFNDIKLTTRLIDGQYPDYKQIIPQEGKTKSIINTQEFIKTIKVNSLFSKSDSADIILEFKDGELAVTSKNEQLGESTASFDIEKQGNDNKIILNYRYLIDGLNNLKSDEVLFEMTDSNNPCILKPKGKDDYLYLIMPIRE